MTLFDKSHARLGAMQAIYAIDFDVDLDKPHLLDNIIKYYKVSGESENIDSNFLKKLVALFLKYQQQLDAEIILFLADGWRLEQVHLVLLSILRLGVGEIMYLKEIPPNVIIDEYTSMASRFYDSKETGFINATLQKIAAKYRA
jgi:transcription antitermination protein NusB